MTMQRQARPKTGANVVIKGAASQGCLVLTILRMKGAEPALLLKEASSYDTIGNGFFAMTIHAIPAGWRCVLWVHVSRAG